MKKPIAAFRNFANPSKIFKAKMEKPEKKSVWFTRGINYLLPKSGDNEVARIYRRITCLTHCTRP
jgi:hypothetical protein